GFEMLKQAFFGGVAAGVAVGIGGAVFMACDNRYVGAVLFSVALLSICYLGMYLFTGKVGYLGEEFTCDKLKCLGIGLLGNYLGATWCGLLVSLVRPALTLKALASCAVKLEYHPLVALGLGFFCGILMYIAVKVYAEKSTPIAILFCIPTFILAGFEHSIADMFYLALARTFSLRSFLFLLMVVVGNALGGVTLPLLRRLGEERKPREEDGPRAEEAPLPEYFFEENGGDA
ncbi:MAG: formate/nitrite transporter family protein, partial [Clostridia bacterium]|nr:formate/nitrite transporter family protein [Clostridia bacterium]